MPNGYVSQIQINGGDVQNIGSCAYAVCDTAEDVSVKVVTLPGFVLKDGATIHVKFMYRNIAFNPKLNVNGTGDKTILLNTNSGFDSSLNLSSQYNVDQLWMAGAVVTLTYDGTYWVVNNPSRITSPYTYNLSAGNTIEPGSYMILADIEWELCTGASSATARVFPFKVCMSTMVDGVYRDRSAIMEVFVGGGYNKKDYVDIMIHDESEYHVNNDYVFDSLVDSVFIYFEYEVSSGNVISKRTGHLLGKVPSRWSSFQLVPLTNGSVSSADPDEDHHFLKLDIVHSASSFVPSETSQTSIPSGNVLPTTVGVHRYLIKARMKPFEIGQLSGNGSTAGQYLKSNGSTSAPSWETMDTTPTANSTNPVTSGGIKTALDAKQPNISITTNTSTPADNDTVIMQASGTTNTTTFLRRTMSKIWDYIKSKADNAYPSFLGVVTNGFLYSQYQAFDWRLHDYFYALDNRNFNISWKIYDSSDVEVSDLGDSIYRLFDGNSESGGTISANTPAYYSIIRFSNCNYSLASGIYLVGFYYKHVPLEAPVLKIRRQNRESWETLTATKYLLNYTGDVDGNCYYLYHTRTSSVVVDLELTINGRTDRNVTVSNLCFFRTRSNSVDNISAVTKYAVTQNLYGEVVAPKFIVRGGTNKQMMLANGTVATLPLSIANGGTGATTATNAEYNLITKPRTTELTSALSDDYRIPFCNTSPSTSVGTFAGYRKASAFWTYIQGKISSVLGLTSTNYGGTSAKATSDADGNNITTTYATLTDLAEKRDKYQLTSSWIGQNLAGTTYGVACRFKLTSVSEARTIYMRINARGVIHNLKILASSSSLAIGDRQAGKNANDDEVYGHLDTSTGIVTIYLKMRNYREGASVTEFNPAGYYYYNNRLTDVTFPNKESVDTLPEGYVTAVQDGWARYDSYGNDISTYYQPVLTAGTGLSISDNTINHSNSVTAQTSNLGSSVRIPAIKYDAQGHITYGTYYDVFSSDLYSVIKCGYINNSTSGVGWMKVGEVTYWTGTYQRYTVVISVIGNHVNTYNDFGILRIRLSNSTTAGVASSPGAQWLVKTAGSSTRFKTDCIRMVKNETSSSSGVTLSIYMYVASSSDSYNFQVINEAVSGATRKSHLLKFSNSTAKETTEPSPTYSSVMAPLELGNQSNCLVITNDNWQSYLTASNGNNNSFGNCDILTIPEGISSIFFSQSLIVGTTETMEANIALVRGAGSLGRFPRNGVRISIAGNWRPQQNGGFSGPVEGRFSNYLYNLRSGWAGGSEAYRIYDVFEDFMYFNGVWYSKGY